MCSVVLSDSLSVVRETVRNARMTDAQIEKCHQPFCSCIHKHGYQFTLLCGLRLSRKTRVAAASHFQTIAFIKCEHVNLNEHLGGPSGKNSKVPSFPKPYFATKLHRGPHSGFELVTSWCTIPRPQRSNPKNTTLAGTK